MNITSKVKNYTLEFCTNVFEQKNMILGDALSKRKFYFVDEKFYRLYEAKIKDFISTDFYCLIKADEDNKSYLKLADYYQALIEAGFRKGDVLVTFGGGVLQDISGFIASTLYRGIPWIFFPTTLLAQADSCIGSKTSINFGNAKNLIGSFYPPDRIFIDLQFCRTLNEQDFNSGLGEIIKFHLLSSPKQCELLNKFLMSADLRQSVHFKNVVESTLRIKRSYFEEDEFDTGRRNLLNYGHCFGHALESASRFAVSHGEAVLVGMGFANLLALHRGIMKKETYDVFEKIIRPFYPKFELSNIRVDDLIGYLKMDKKRAGPELTFIMAADIGVAAKYDDVTESEVKTVYARFLKDYPVREEVLR